MSKKIEDYLHLYLNSDVDVHWKQSDQAGTHRIDLWHHLASDDYDEIKLVLRPISDITEAEAIKCSLLSLDGCLPPEGANMKLYYETLSFFYDPAEFLYLLSIGIDLFGLIDAGLALDKTKLNTHEVQ